MQWFGRVHHTSGMRRSGEPLKRVFNIDITVCPLCDGSMSVVADIIDPDIIQKILDHIEPQPPPLKTATTIHS